MKVTKRFVFKCYHEGKSIGMECVNVPGIFSACTTLDKMHPMIVDAVTTHYSDEDIVEFKDVPKLGPMLDICTDINAFYKAVDVTLDVPE